MRIQRLLDVEKGLDGALQNGSERDVEPGRESETKWELARWDVSEQAPSTSLAYP